MRDSEKLMLKSVSSADSQRDSGREEEEENEFEEEDHLHFLSVTQAGQRSTGIDMQELEEMMAHSESYVPELIGRPSPKTTRSKSPEKSGNEVNRAQAKFVPAEPHGNKNAENVASPTLFRLADHRPMSNPGSPMTPKRKAQSLEESTVEPLRTASGAKGTGLKPGNFADEAFYCTSLTESDIRSFFPSTGNKDKAMGERNETTPATTSTIGTVTAYQADSVDRKYGDEDVSMRNTEATEPHESVTAKEGESRSEKWQIAIRPSTEQSFFQSLPHGSSPRIKKKVKEKQKRKQVSREFHKIKAGGADINSDDHPVVEDESEARNGQSKSNSKSGKPFGRSHSDGGSSKIRGGKSSANGVPIVRTHRSTNALKDQHLDASAQVEFQETSKKEDASTLKNADASRAPLKKQSSGSSGKSKGHAVQSDPDDQGRISSSKKKKHERNEKGAVANGEIGKSGKRHKDAETKRRKKGKGHSDRERKSVGKKEKSRSKDKERDKEAVEHEREKRSDRESERRDGGEKEEKEKGKKSDNSGSGKRKSKKHREKLPQAMTAPEMMRLDLTAISLSSEVPTRKTEAPISDHSAPVDVIQASKRKNKQQPIRTSSQTRSGAESHREVHPERAVMPPSSSSSNSHQTTGWVSATIRQSGTKHANSMKEENGTSSSGAVGELRAVTEEMRRIEPEVESIESQKAGGVSFREVPVEQLDLHRDNQSSSVSSQTAGPLDPVSIPPSSSNPDPSTPSPSYSMMSRKPRSRRQLLMDIEEEETAQQHAHRLAFDVAATNDTVLQHLMCKTDGDSPSRGLKMVREKSLVRISLAFGKPKKKDKEEEEQIATSATPVANGGSGERKTRSRSGSASREGHSGVLQAVGPIASAPAAALRAVRGTPVSATSSPVTQRRGFATPPVTSTSASASPSTPPTATSASSSPPIATTSASGVPLTLKMTRFQELRATRRNERARSLDTAASEAAPVPMISHMHRDKIRAIIETDDKLSIFRKFIHAKPAPNGQAQRKTFMAAARLTPHGDSLVPIPSSASTPATLRSSPAQGSPQPVVVNGSVDDQESDESIPVQDNGRLQAATSPSPPLPQRPQKPKKMQSIIVGRVAVLHRVKSDTILVHARQQFSKWKRQLPELSKIEHEDTKPRKTPLQDTQVIETKLQLHRRATTTPAQRIRKPAAPQRSAVSPTSPPANVRAAFPRRSSDGSFFDRVEGRTRPVARLSISKLSREVFPPSDTQRSTTFTDESSAPSFPSASELGSPYSSPVQTSSSVLPTFSSDSLSESMATDPEPSEIPSGHRYLSEEDVHTGASTAASTYRDSQSESSARGEAPDLRAIKKLEAIATSEESPAESTATKTSSTESKQNEASSTTISLTTSGHVVTEVREPEFKQEAKLTDSPKLNMARRRSNGKAAAQAMREWSKSESSSPTRNALDPGKVRAVALSDTALKSMQVKKKNKKDKVKGKSKRKRSRSKRKAKMRSKNSDGTEEDGDTSSDANTKDGERVSATSNNSANDQTSSGSRGWPFSRSANGSSSNAPVVDPSTPEGTRRKQSLVQPFVIPTTPAPNTAPAASSNTNNSINANSGNTNSNSTSGTPTNTSPVVKPAPLRLDLLGRGKERTRSLPGIETIPDEPLTPVTISSSRQPSTTTSHIGNFRLMMLRSKDLMRSDDPNIPRSTALSRSLSDLVSDEPTTLARSLTPTPRTKKPRSSTPVGTRSPFLRRLRRDRAAEIRSESSESDGWSSSDALRSPSSARREHHHQQQQQHQFQPLASPARERRMIERARERADKERKRQEKKRLQEEKKLDKLITDKLKTKPSRPSFLIFTNLRKNDASSNSNANLPPFSPGHKRVGALWSPKSQEKKEKLERRRSREILMASKCSDLISISSADLSSESSSKKDTSGDDMPSMRDDVRGAAKSKAWRRSNSLTNTPRERDFLATYKGSYLTII
jgi:hypothetical protein